MSGSVVAVYVAPSREMPSREIAAGFSSSRASIGAAVLIWTLGDPPRDPFAVNVGEVVEHGEADELVDRDAQDAGLFGDRFGGEAVKQRRHAPSLPGPEAAWRRRPVHGRLIAVGVHTPSTADGAETYARPPSAGAHRFA